VDTSRFSLLCQESPEELTRGRYYLPPRPHNDILGFSHDVERIRTFNNNILAREEALSFLRLRNVPLSGSGLWGIRSTEIFNVRLFMKRGIRAPAPLVIPWTARQGIRYAVS
jgi:hypothetical protein